MTSWLEPYRDPGRALAFPSTDTYAMTTDDLGNPLAPGLPYARGNLVTSTADDLAKLRHAWRVIDQRLRRGEDVYNFTGLERGFAAGEEGLLDDELAPARHADRLAELACEHMGGVPGVHDVMVFNRQTGAIVAAMMVMARRGDTVVGVSPRYSHPCVARGAEHAGARFVDVVGAAGLRRALEDHDRVGLVVLTRLAVSYEILPQDELNEVIELAHAHGVRVLLDDAGGARVGPAIFGQSPALALGVDVASTGLDKYGTSGPRLGLMVGDQALVSEIRALAFGLGLEARPMLYPAVVQSLEQYSPARVRELVGCTQRLGATIGERLGERLSRGPVIAFLRGEDTLAMCMERSGLESPPVVPIEATAALAMTLLGAHGIHTVHLAAIPPGTSALLIKFIPPETLERFGGAEAFAEAIDASITAVADVIGDEPRLRRALFGSGKPR